MHKKVWITVVLAAFAFPATANAGGLNVQDPDPSWDEGPPRGAYVWLNEEQMDATPDVPDVQFGGNHILFLNRCQGGLTITSSNQNDSVNNQSTVGGGTFPEYAYGDASWNELVAETRRIFEPYAITVTDEDPSPAPHDEAIVCGTPGVIGLPNGVGGVAPFSCGQIPNAITFTFAAVYGGEVEQMVATIGQEAAHAWGLEHLLSCNDPMTYLNSPWAGEGSCWPKEFQDQETQCGEYSPRSCDCGGSTQNSHQHILDMFGAGIPDTQSPLAAIISPADGAAFPVGATFPIEVEVSDDQTITSVTLFANGAPSPDLSAPFGPFPAENTPEGTYEMYIEAEDGAGNVTISETITIHVNANGEPPATTGGDTAGGSDSAGGDGGSDSASGDGGSDSASGDGGDGGDDSGALPTETGGSGLPPEYGLANETADGCACTVDGSDGDRWGLLFMGVMFGAGLRSRRRR